MPMVFLSKYLYVCFCLLLLCVAPLPLAAKDKTHSCKQFVVAGAEQWLPFAYQQVRDGELAAFGIAHDVIKLVASDMDIEVVQKVAMPWKRMELELEQGSLDILAGNYWSKERERKWLLTTAIAHEPVKLLILSSNTFEFNRLTDLIGKVGVVPRGISLGQEFDLARKDLRILEVRTHEQMYEMLNLGRVDYLVSPEFAALQQLKKAQNHNIAFLPKAINLYPVHLSFSRHSSCSSLFSEFNSVLKSKLSDGSIAAILQSYRHQGGGL